MGKTVEAIEKAAQAEVEPKLIDRGQTTKKELEEERDRKEAEGMVHEAMGKTDIPALRRAIERAVQTHACEELVASARERLAFLEEEARKQREREEATRLLESAMTATDIEALGIAIDRAVQAEVPHELIVSGQHRKTELEAERAREKAEGALRSAICETD